MVVILVIRDNVILRINKKVKLFIGAITYF